MYAHDARPHNSIRRGRAEADWRVCARFWSGVLRPDPGPAHAAFEIEGNSKVLVCVIVVTTRTNNALRHTHYIFTKRQTVCILFFSVEIRERTLTCAQPHG